MNLKILKILLIIILIGNLFCNNETIEISQKKITFNGKLKEIYDARNNKNLAIISRYLTDNDPYVKEKAIISVAASGISENYNLLIPLLTDANPRIRLITAYAIGLLGNPKSENALISAYKAESYNEVKKQILEALAMCASEYGIKFICSVDYKQDKQIEEGVAWALVRLAQKQMISQQCVNTAFDILKTSEPNSTIREIISFFFEQAQSYDFSRYLKTLHDFYKTSLNPIVKANIITAISRINTQQSLQIIKDGLQSDKREIVINAIKAAENFSYVSCSSEILNLLKNNDYAIALSAAEYIEKKGTSKDVKIYKKIAKEVEYWEVAVKLYAAILKYSPNKGDVLNTITNAIEVSNNNYEKGKLLLALGYYPPAYNFVNKIFNTTSEQLMKTYAAQSLLKMLNNKNFKQYTILLKQKNNDDLYTEFYLFFRNAMNTNDNALIYYASKAFTNPIMKNYIIDNYENVYFLDNTLNSLMFPRDFKTFFQLCDAIKYIEDKDCPPSVNIQNSNIKWDYISNLNSNLYIKIYTSKGEILIKLNPQEAPVSVSQFIARVENKEYNSQKIYKVIPNKGVFCGGKRGDGWETDNITIANEYYPTHFQTGTFALRTLGQNYQSTLWFIATYPSVELDNQYTILGKVIKGMDVVYNLTTNDDIISIEIIKELN